MASESDTPKQNPVETVNEGSAAEQKNNKIPPILRTKAQMPPANTDSNNTQQDRQYRLDRKRFWVEVVTCLAVISYGWVAYRQWDEMRKSTDAAKRATDVAEATLKSTTESSRLDQRAWVSVPQFIQPAINAGSKATFGVVLTNTGKSPALKLVSRVAVKFLPTNEKFIPVYPRLMSKITPNVLYPGMKIYPRVTTPGELTQSIIDAVHKSNLTVYVFGDFNYEDIFKQPHRGTFCIYLEPDFATVHSCDTYNEAN